MPDQQRIYFAYVLRLWRASEQDQCVWRASLERPDTGERKGFATLQDLFDFLTTETGTYEQEGEHS